ncbi:MAG: PIG-L family deacetylase [Bryobacteraceae bacterium]
MSAAARAISLWQNKITRKQFLLSLGLAASTRATASAEPAEHPKILLVVAHPDDEYTFAATVYRIAKELHGTVDQVVITNGEAGYRYSQLAELYYNASLTNESVGRARLPDIRRQETLAAGRILGIREHQFLEQKDTRFTLDASEALAQWDTNRILQALTARMRRERYDFVFTLLPTAGTHGHHKAATLLALEAVRRLPEDLRPAVLAGDPAASSDAVLPFEGLAAHPETSPWPGAPVFRFDRTARFGFKDSLNYQIVVNWVIAEHKSQGLFQTDCNKHDEERFWLLAPSGPHGLEQSKQLFDRLPVLAPHHG